MNKRMAQYFVLENGLEFLRHPRQGRDLEVDNALAVLFRAEQLRVLASMTDEERCELGEDMP